MTRIAIITGAASGIGRALAGALVTGGDTVVVADGTATFGRVDYNGKPRDAEDVHALSLANLQGEYARIAGTAEILAALRSETPSRF